MPYKNIITLVDYAKILVSLSPIIRAGTDLSFGYLSLFLTKNRKGHAPIICYLLLFCVVTSVFFSPLLNIFTIQEVSFHGITYGFLAIAFVALLIMAPSIDMRLFLNGLLVVAVTYSFWVLMAIYFSPLSFSYIPVLKAGLREYVVAWPQRFPLVVVFASFVVLSRILKNGIRFKYLAMLVLFIIVIIGTYSRAIYLSVIIGGASLFIGSLFSFSWRRKRAIRGSVIFGALLFGSLLFAQDEIATILERGASGIQGIFLAEELDNRGSDYLRRQYFIIQIQEITQRPFFGTGGAGISNISNVGSSHSQYLDFAVRFGIPAALLFVLNFIWLIRRVLSFDLALGAGLISIFFFGFVHETTRLGYMSAIFILIYQHAAAKSSAKSNDVLVESRLPSKEVRSGRLH